MKSLDNYIIEKFRISKNTKLNTWEEKEWVVFLPEKVPQYPEEYFLCHPDSDSNAYVFSREELKELYENNPKKYPNYWICKLNKDYFIANIEKIIKGETTPSRRHLEITGDGKYISSFIEAKYIQGLS